MLKNLIFSLIAFFAVTTGLAQHLKPELGHFSVEDWQMTSYADDPSAEAVVLFDVGLSEFIDSERGYDIRFVRTRRIKILKQSGEKYAEVSIPFYVDGYGRTEAIRAISASTWNMVNGKPVESPVDKKSIFEEQVSSKWFRKKFAFPDVHEGSIIEYQYVLETPIHFNLPDWYFQDFIPTIYSEYTVKMIPFYEYIYIAQGLKGFDYYNTKIDRTERKWGNVAETNFRQVGKGVIFQDKIHTYVMREVPAFRDESFITSPEDYLQKIDFQLAKYYSPMGGEKDIISTWPELSKELIKQKEFGKYSDGCERFAKKLLKSELQLPEGSQTAKAKFLVEYVKSNYHWNGEKSKFASKKPGEFFEQRTGNSADINLFLAALLTAAEIHVSPVLLSTRDHGKIHIDYPFLHFFNYVVLLVQCDNVSFLADATEDRLPYNRLPPRCMNDKGLVVDEDEGGWIDLITKEESVESFILQLYPDPEKEQIEVTATIHSTGLEAYRYRDEMGEDEQAIRDKMIDHGLSKTEMVKLVNFDRVELPYSVSLSGIASFEKIEDKIVISPFLSFPPRENKLKMKHRTYPIDFVYPKTIAMQSIISIPAGYTLVEIPEHVNYENPLVAILLEYELSDGKLMAKGSFTVRKALYHPAEYDEIKKFFNIVIDRFSQQVVLVAKDVSK